MSETFRRQIQQASQDMSAEAGNLAELLRAKRVRSLGVLNSPPEKVYDDIVALAARLCGMDGAVLTFVDDKTAYIKASYKGETGVQKLEESFCNVAIRTPKDVMIVPDARLDDRFSNYPLVTSNSIRFYAGMPLTTDDGYAMGALCVVDPQPRQFDDQQIDALQRFARVVTELVTRKIPVEK